MGQRLSDGRIPCGQYSSGCKGLLDDTLTTAGYVAENGVRREELKTATVAPQTIPTPRVLQRGCLMLWQA